MTYPGYVGPPAHQLVQEFINGWRVLHERFTSSLKLPSLEEELDLQFLELKTQLVQRSRVIDLVTEKAWGLHNKIKGLVNSLQSLDHFRQESIIFHDNMGNQWHDISIQASKMAAIFLQRAQEEAQE